MAEQSSKTFIIIYLSFWAYFEYKIVKSFLWKKFGKEKLWIKDGILSYQREINKKGKINTYNVEFIQDIKIIEVNNTSWSDTINQSFWVKAGERLQFTVQSKIIRFGLQINDSEAQTIYSELKKFN